MPEITTQMENKPSELPEIDLSGLPDKNPVDELGIDLSGLPDKGTSDSQLSWTQGKPEPTFFEKLTSNPWNAITDLLPKESKEDIGAKAVNAIGIADMLNKQYQEKGIQKTVSPSFVYDNMDAFTKELGIRGIPNTEEMLTMASMPAIAAGFAMNPLGAFLGLAAYQAISEAESYAVNLAKKENYKIFQNKGISALLPEDTSSITKDVIDTFDLVAKGLLVGAGFKKAPSIAEGLTKNIITEYNLPKTIYIDPANLKVELQTGGVIPAGEMEIIKGLGLTGEQYKAALRDGINLEIPAEKIITIQDKPWYSTVKKLFKLDPNQQIVKTFAGEVKNKPVAGLIEGKGIPVETVKQAEAIKPQQAEITAEQPVKTEGLQIADLEKMFEEDKSPEEFMQILEGKETEVIPSEKPSELPQEEALLKEPSAMKQEAPTLLDRTKHDEIFSKDINTLTPDEAKYQLTHDELTGLKNRKVFDKQTGPVTGIIDLDNFKIGNDVFGHEQMDEFLKDLGENLKTEGLYDIVTRLHGDEFGAKVMSNEHALQVKDAFNRALQKSGMVVELVSGNKYLYQGGGASYGFDKDIKSADKALYEDKAVRKRAGLRGTGDFPESVSFTPETEWGKLSWREVQNREVEGRRGQLKFLKDWLSTKEGVVKLKDSEGNVKSRLKSDREQIFQNLSKEYNYSYAQIQNLLERAINDKPLIDKPKTPASLEKATQFIEDILAKTKDLYDKSEGNFLTSPETKTFKPKPVQQDMLGAKTGLEGKLPSEEIKGKTALEIATENAKIREAQKGQGNLIEYPLLIEAKKYKSAEDFINSKFKSATDLRELGNDIPKENQNSLFKLETRHIQDLQQVDYMQPYEWKTEYGKGMKDAGKKGELSPIIIKEDGTILDGNHRFEIYLKLGKREVQVYVETNLTKSQLNDIWNKAQKGQGDINLESSGLQTLYETLMKKAKVPETAYSDLVELGKYVYDKGGNTASSWMKGMKEHLGKLWDTYKKFLTKIWNEIKKIAGNQRGSAGWESKGETKLSELDKQDELFKVGILEAYKAGKEVYKAGNKEGVKQEHARIMELQKQKKLHDMIKVETKDMINDIRDIQENLKNTHPIAADAITKVLDSIDLSNMSTNKRAELEPLYAYYKAQEGTPIPENLIKPLSNLDKKPVKELTLDELRNIHLAVMEAAKLGEKLEKIESGYETVITRMSKIKPSVAVSYQKMIKEALSDFDPKKLNDKSLQDLQKTKEYLDSVNPEDIGMEKETYNKLKKSTERLNKKRLQDMTLEEKKELAETLQRLNAQGRVMRQLELARREHTRQGLSAKLLNDTSTLDPKKDTTFKQGAKELYENSLTTYRVADNLDNFKEGGMNKQFIADQFIKETESDYTAYQQNADFITKAKAIKPEWTDKEQQRIVVNALDIMGAKTQRDMLMQELEIKEMPVLTDAENKLLLLIEETMNQNKHDIAAIFEYRENQIFPEIKRYIFPLKYEAQKNLVNAEILRHDYHKTKEVDDYFTEQRAKGVKKLIRTDLFNIVRQSFEEQNWYINMQPTLDTQASVLFTKEFKAKAGNMGYDWWKDQIDITARRGYSAKSDTLFRKTEKWLKESRVNLNNAIMGYKVSSAVMQIFSVFDGMATALTLQKPKAALTMIPNVISAWLKKPEIIKMSKALQMRTGGEQALREIVDRGFKNKFTEWGYSALKTADLRTASGVMKSFYNAIEGKTEIDKIQQAELLMSLSQGGNAVTLRPHVLASGEMMRTAFTFQTFFLNRWGLVANDIINRGIIHGDAKTKSYAVAALATIIVGSILEDDAREELWQLISGKKPKKEVAPVKKVLANLIETVPLAGRAMSSTIQGSRGDTDVPIVRLGKQGLGGAWDVINKEKSKDKVKGALKAIEMILSVKYGIAGTAQTMDLIEGAMNDRR